MVVLRYKNALQLRASGVLVDFHNCDPKLNRHRVDSGVEHSHPLTNRTAVGRCRHMIEGACGPLLFVSLVALVAFHFVPHPLRHPCFL